MHLENFLFAIIFSKKNIVVKNSFVNYKVLQTNSLLVSQLTINEIDTKAFRICKNFPVSIADALTGFF